MKLTLQDLARICEVDTSTVSRALRNDPRISRATTEKVQGVARRLGYLPNLAARMLKQGSSRIFWFLVPTLGALVDWRIAERASIVSTENAYDVVVSLHHGLQGDFDRLIDRMGSGLAAGAIINRRDIEDITGVQRLLDVNFPVVFADVPAYALDASVVTTDNRTAITELIDFLIADGAEGFLLLINRERNRIGERRREVAVKALAKAGLPFAEIPEEKWELRLKTQKRIGILASGQESIQRFLAENTNQVSGKTFIAGCFDEWRGGTIGLESVTVAVQDYDAIAEAAVAHLFSCINNGYGLASRQFPVKSYHRVSDRYGMEALPLPKRSAASPPV